MIISQEDSIRSVNKGVAGAIKLLVCFDISVHSSPVSSRDKMAGRSTSCSVRGGYFQGYCRRK